MNSSRKAKTVDSSGLCQSRGSAYLRLLQSCARIGVASGSSPLLALNTPELLRVGQGKWAIWLDKQRALWRSAAQMQRFTGLQRRSLTGNRPGARQWSELAARLCSHLGIDWSGQCARGLAVIAEPATLACNGLDVFGRPLWLRPDALIAWTAMRSAAQHDGVLLLPISGWRSMHYQARLLASKLARGQTLAQMLTVSAAPGFSEHHAGTALDLAAAGDLALEERFETSAAFAWLQQHAQRFGFVLSLPRGNRFGYAYEPWHWRFDPC